MELTALTVKDSVALFYVGIITPHKMAVNRKGKKIF